MQNMEYMNFDCILTMLVPKIFKVEKAWQDRPYYLPSYKKIGRKVEFLKRHATWVNDDAVVFDGDEHNRLDRFPCYNYLVLQAVATYEDEDLEDEERAGCFKELRWFLYGFNSMSEVINHFDRYASKDDEPSDLADAFVFFKDHAAYEEARLVYGCRKADGIEMEMDFTDFKFFDRYPPHKDCTKFIKLEGVCELCTEESELMALPCHSIRDLVDNISYNLLIDIMNPDEDITQEGKAFFGGETYSFECKCIDGTGFVAVFNEAGERLDFGMMQFLPLDEFEECEDSEHSEDSECSSSDSSDGCGCSDGCEDCEH